MGQQNQQMRRARLVASVAATIISLACGTNYVYSAWAPQFAEKLKLSATQSNLIGQFGNLGMYSLGVPVGMLVDRRGPRPFVLVGAFLLVAGYFPLHMAYDRASGSVTALCFFSFLTGLGSCMAFAAAVKTSALNWPGHRGTATAFPLAAFGLSAFFFSFLGSVLFPGDPSAFLKLLSFGTVGLTFIGFFFLKVYPHSNHRVICHEEGRRSSSSSAHLRPPRGIRHSEEPDIRGFNLLRNQSFWLLFTIMAILSGVGLMTINNIGNDVNALWKRYDGSVTEDFLVHRQQMHVSILSVCSFVGRLLSGVGSDFLVKSLHASRLWCLFVASIVFLVAQVCALNIENPRLLGFVSGLSGLGYGFLFGVFPSLVTEAFGIRGLSQNWGFMTLAPVISSNIFNLFYGLVLDSHSVFDPSGERSCHDGLECYRAAYWMTLVACLLGIVFTLRTVQHERIELASIKRKTNTED